MSKRSLKNGNLENDDISRPAILRRKRKANSDVEHCSNASNNCDTGNTSGANGSKTFRVQPRQNVGGTPSQPATSAATLSQFRGLANLTPSTSKNNRESPLPAFNWANPQEVWDLMVQKDIAYPRNHDMFSRHPELQARMRAILLDWLSEVCEVYKLHRETFYLAQDYIDRYLGRKFNVPRSQLQLLGITALFVAAKMEEIYPPKLNEFSYVTDGACTQEEILDKEIVILQTLNWDLTPMTINSWLCIYLQLACNLKSDKATLLFPGFSGLQFAQVAQLLDLCILDVGCLQFSYSVIAASALSHLLGRQLAYSVSGLKMLDLMPCYKWMVPFAQVIKENGGSQLKFCSKSNDNSLHHLLVHNTDLILLEKAHTIHNHLPLSEKSLQNNCANGLLTPPQSCKKASN